MLRSQAASEPRRTPDDMPEGADHPGLHDSLFSRMKQYVRDLTDSFGDRVEKASKTIASRIDSIAVGFAGECYYDESDSPENIWMSKNHVKDLNTFRIEHPEHYKKMADFAEKFGKLSPEKQIQESQRFVSDLLKELDEHGRRTGQGGGTRVAS